MIRIFVVVAVCALAMCYVQAKGGTPQIKCEVGAATWCIATFDGSINMQDVGNARIWVLQARADRRSSPMKITETKACSDITDETVRLVNARTNAVTSPAMTQVVEYALGSNGCKLRFEIPEGESNAMYRQLMLYGILVGPEKRMQLYKLGK